MTTEPRRHALAACACLLLASCSEEPDRDPHEEEEVVDDVRTLDASREAGRPARDAASAPLDGRVSRPPPQRPQECMPGRYEGEFNCVISNFLPWQGKMSFSLVEQTRNGGEFTSLEIVPGTRISGSDDSFQGMFTAELAGTFDCETGALTGALEDGTYLVGGFMEYQLAGPLEGSYQLGDGGAPGFSGEMGPLTSATFDLYGPFAPMAMCTWQASRTGSAAGDGGSP
jgi:hypothetical protein